MTGDELKAKGQAKAAKKAGEAWREDALFWLRYWIATFRKTEVTFDAFRETGFAPEPPNPNVWGTLPRSAIKAGLIQPTDRVAKAQRPQAQSRIVKVWKVVAA